MSSEAKTTSDHLLETPSPTVTELISDLKTCFSSIDFQNVTKILMNREQDLLNKTHFLENEKDEILKENKKLNGLLKKKDVKIESLEKENEGLKNEVKKKQNDIKKKVLDLDGRVLSLEKLNKELLGSGDHSVDFECDDDKCISILRRKPVTKETSRECSSEQVNKVPTGTTVSPFLDSGSDDDGKIKEANETILDKQKESESSRKQMFSEKGESQERTNRKFPGIIQIEDDEEEDENNLKDVSPLKRKRSSSNVEVKDDTDDERCISILRRKPVTKELQSECNNDHVNVIPTGGQPLTSHSAIPFLDSESDDEKVEEPYEPIKKNTERWETEAEMIIEFSKSYELCMNAVCALHRQNIVCAYLLPRFNRLAEWLIDGDPERKLKKTPSELNCFELDQCRMLAVNYSAELFKVYQQNADRFFPPRS